MTLTIWENTRAFSTFEGQAKKFTFEVQDDDKKIVLEFEIVQKRGKVLLVSHT